MPSPLNSLLSALFLKEEQKNSEGLYDSPSIARKLLDSGSAQQMRDSNTSRLKEIEALEGLGRASIGSGMSSAAMSPRYAGEDMINQSQLAQLQKGMYMDLSPGQTALHMGGGMNAEGSRTGEEWVVNPLTGMKEPRKVHVPGGFRDSANAQEYSQNAARIMSNQSVNVSAGGTPAAYSGAPNQANAGLANAVENNEEALREAKAAMDAYRKGGIPGWVGHKARDMPIQKAITGGVNQLGELAKGTVRAIGGEKAVEGLESLSDPGGIDSSFLWSPVAPIKGKDSTFQDYGVDQIASDPNASAAFQQNNPQSNSFMAQPAGRAGIALPAMPLGHYRAQDQAPTYLEKLQQNSGNSILDLINRFKYSSPRLEQLGQRGQPNFIR